MSEHRELRIEQLLGRKVFSQDNRPIGRIEDFRAQRRGQGYVTTDIIVGMAGLLERLGIVAKTLVGFKKQPYVVRWDQIDVSNPRKPRLLVPIEELKTENGESR
jgi:hypothetical protein